MTTKDEQSWGLLAHLSTFAGYFVPFGNVLGPLIVWLLKKDESPFVEHHAREALNFQITVFIGISIAAVLSILLIGIPLLVAIGVVDLVFTILAAIKANDGDWYRYPFSLRVIPAPAAVE